MSHPLCATCHHSTYQHPDGGRCRYHPRDEDPCECREYVGEKEREDETDG